MVDFSKLRENRLDKLTKALNEEKSNFKPEDDDKLWYPAVDKSGNGMAVIRFLPTSMEDGNESPWVKKYNHGFQDKNGWLIYDCPTSIGRPCPVCEENTLLWNTDTESNKNLARKRKRKLNIYSNILVINDPKNPENNGKVFVFKYGKSIFDKIELALQPKFEGEEPLDPFHVLYGADFRIKITTVDGYRNYDLSTFDPPSALFDGDEEKIIEVYKKQYPLHVYIDEDVFYSYEEIKKRLDYVLGRTTPATPSQLNTQESINHESNYVETSPSDFEGMDKSDEDELNWFKGLSNKHDDDVPF